MSTMKELEAEMKAHIERAADFGARFRDFKNAVRAQAAANAPMYVNVALCAITDEQIDTLCAQEMGA